MVSVEIFLIIIFYILFIDIDDNDEHEQLVSTLSPTNVDDFINGKFSNKNYFLRLFCI